MCEHYLFTSQTIGYTIRNIRILEIPNNYGTIRCLTYCPTPTLVDLWSRKLVLKIDLSFLY